MCAGYEGVRGHIYPHLALCSQRPFGNLMQPYTTLNSLGAINEFMVAGWEGTLALLRQDLAPPAIN